MRSIKLPSWIERLLGTAPVPAPPHVFGLDPNALRYGAFRHGPQGFVYEESRSLPLPEGLFDSGLLGAPMREPAQLHEPVAEIVRGFETPIKSASLVIPDSWLRLTFTEIAELPRKTAAREDMLRWKLKRLVPFRVEDLRIQATPVRPFPTQDEPTRILIGFALEMLLSQIEGAFNAAGIEIGRIVNTTSAVAASLDHGVGEDDLAGLVVVQEDAFTLSFYLGGEPLIYRYKATGGSVASSTVRRDLALTTSFLQQHFPGTPLARLFLAAPLEEEDLWLAWLHEELGTPPEPLAFEHFQIARTQVGPSWLETAPLLGAAAIEVS